MTLLAIVIATAVASGGVTLALTPRQYERRTRARL
jgi:hypothetical protein